ncbi:MAG: HlyD family efflux transporter periplasmic adaptor subunit [Leptolyngbya sp. SIOISBB]|nr:HlyD family efflux transporter periplasmic adaptor subunit [Leptolyngbya sp. SIOISBB]
MTDQPKRRRWWLGAIGFIALLLVLGGLIRPRELRRTRNQPTLDMLTQPVETVPLTLRVEGTGSVVAEDTVNLSPKTTGRLEALSVEPGDQVQVGEVLAQMEVGTLTDELARNRAQLAQAEADYAKILAGNRSEDIRQAEASVVAAQSQVTLAGTQLVRYRELAAQGAISQSELDQYINEANSAEANFEQAQAQLEEAASGSRPEDITAAAAAVAAAEAQVAATETQIEEAVIRAPFDGVITQTYATVGAIVTPTTSASATASATSSSILAISSGLEVEVDVSEANIARVQVGQSVEIVADAFPQQVFTGQVKRIAPEAVIENNVTLFQVTVTPQTGLDQLKSGMTVDATFIGETVVDALMVPTVAIATESGQLGVQIADDEGNPTFQPVTVGLTQDGKTQILSGLETDDRVFLDVPDLDRERPSFPP